MSRVESQYRLPVPATLEAQLLDFRRKVWSTKMLEASGVAAVGLLAAFHVVFALDRLWDTPAGLRWGILLTAAFACAIGPFYLYRWVWRYQRFEQLARLLSRKLPRVGDQLLGVLELSHSESEQARSRILCEAAIKQVAEVAETRDLRQAAPNSRHLLWGSIAVALLSIALCLSALFPAAAENALARLAAPWSEIPRYTFAAVQALPERLVVAHGEPFEVVLGLLDGSLWRPGEGSAEIGNERAVQASLEDDQYRFQLPAQIEASWLSVRIGDSTQRVRVEPKLRPELASVIARVTLPAYLGRVDPIQADARGGSVSLVKGSRATFEATATRALQGATVDGAARKPVGRTVSTAPVHVENDRRIEFSWKDEFGLEGKEPFRLSVGARDDEVPSIACEGLPQRKVVLDSEQIVFSVKAQDDFGVKAVGFEWRGVDSEAVEKPAHGEHLLGAGDPNATRLELTGTFAATALGIEPQPVEVRVFTEDYYPGRPRVYSSAHLLYVLNAEQHAIWITEQLSKWHRQSLEVRDRELQLYEVNKQLRALSADVLDQPETRRRIESQAAAEQANARRLTHLTGTGASLLREAARNPEIGVGHLEKWAEMLKILKDISANRMPSVADLLKQAAQAAGLAKAVPGAGKSVGQTRSAQFGGGSKPEGQPKPAAPTLTDIESSQQPLQNPAAPPGPKKASAAGLGLPTTQLPGKAGPPSAPKPKVEQAVVEQKDLLAEFERIADELNTLLANLEGSTLVKRLKAASRGQYRVAGRISDRVESAFALSRATQDTRQAVDELVQEELKSSQTVSIIMDDMQAYFERRRMVQFKTVLDDMRAQDVIGALRRLSEELPIEQGVSIAQCEYWSDVLDRWAEDLVDPACKGECPGCRGRGSLPPSIVLEVLKILEAEINLREDTRVAEQARPAKKREEYVAEANKLSGTQEALGTRVVKVIERIRELTDGDKEFAREIALLGQVSVVMNETVQILTRPNTGAQAIAAETEVIELLLKTRRMKPGGGGGGAEPGGGGGGTTEDAALAMIGAGLNEKEVREDRGVTQSLGKEGSSLPEEFRAGLDEYFNQLERTGKK